ncbi:hypothetical protein V493_07123 [Pseudogymnoascus sp. VKM F-4281 (FW-2241)]|nr:hypothetical protein V493_07123 [Pseudogymnoascus sp. VKM F-4281 (FW-2241)]
MNPMPRRILLGGRPLIRYFTQRPLSRPQLPYLHHSSPRPRTFYARLLTKERKAWLKMELRWGIYILSGAGLLYVAAYGFEMEKMERECPSPHEYTFWSRKLYRSARVKDSEKMRDAGGVRWRRSGERYMEILKRLEDPEIDGAGIVQQGEDESQILIPGVGRSGYDITAKPEPWRRGYYEVLLGAARAAEFLDSCVRDKNRDLVFPKIAVIGPSNPNPRPLPPGRPSPPHEDDCEPAFLPPETFYMRILTTNGFTEAQRLSAALAYASWLDYKGTPEAAAEMYKWGLDIAKSGIAEPEAVVDPVTYTIKPTAVAPSRNVLRATTAMGEHKARNKDLAGALPIFLSVLRARRALPPAPPKEVEGGGGLMKHAVDLVRFWLVPPEFTPPPPDGNLPPVRGPEEKCEEAALMAWIGEMMYASASDIAGKESGLAWTRESVDVAEEELRAGVKEDRKCRQCLQTGLDNWGQMVGKLAKEEKKRRKEGGVVKKGWFGRGEEVMEEGIGRWEAEERLVWSRFRRARELLDVEKVDLTKMYIFR